MAMSPNDNNVLIFLALNAAAHLNIYMLLLSLYCIISHQILSNLYDQHISLLAVQYILYLYSIRYRGA